MKSDNINRENGHNAFKLLKKLLERIGWVPQSTDSDDVLLVDFEKDNMPIRDAIFSVNSHFERFLCYFNFRDIPSKDRQSELIEFITRANFNLVIGNFEYDYESGKIRFKSSIDFSNEVLSESLIRNTIQSSIDVIEQYADVLIEVLRGVKTAKEAISETENSLNNDE